MGKQLVLVGAGHVHLTCLKNLRTFIDAGHQVTVIGPSAYHYYSGMGPGLLSGIYKPEEVRFHVKKMTEDRGGTFITGNVIKIDPRGRWVELRSGKELKYDVISFNTGSVVPVEDLTQEQHTVFPAKPIENLLHGRQQVLTQLKQKVLHITVAGGGPAGVEIAANLRRLVKDAGGQAEIVMIAGKGVLASFRPKVRNYALNALQELGIQVQEGVKVKRFNDGVIKLTDGSEFNSDLLFVAVGIEPSPIFRTSGLPTGEDGGLLVNEYLQSVTYPEVFGGGDCISFQPQPLAKIGVYAVRENPIILHNLRAALEGKRLRKFSPQKNFLLILNMGDNTGIVARHPLVWRGKLGFTLKDYIDRKFMHAFQVSGEREE